MARVPASVGESDMTQTSFTSAEFASKEHKTRREQFLAKRNAAVPWARLERLIEAQ
jgi:hypothetical protein